VVDWYRGVVRKGKKNKIVYRVPRWAYEYWSERTLKVICWMDLGKPSDLDIDSIEIEVYEEEKVGLNIPL